MARYYKKWEEHSPRWQREQSRKGLDKKRWNAWLKLSNKTRKETTPNAYAAGKSVANQRRERKEQLAVKRIKAASRLKGRTATVQRNVSRMSDQELDWTIKATDRQIRVRAGDKSIKGQRGTNPWWYN